MEVGRDVCSAVSLGVVWINCEKVMINDVDQSVELNDLNTLYDKRDFDNALERSKMLISTSDDLHFISELRRFRSDVFSKLGQIEAALSERKMLIENSNDIEDYFFASLYAARASDFHAAINYASQGINNCENNRSNDYQQELRFILAYSNMRIRNRDLAMTIMEEISEDFVMFIEASKIPLSKMKLVERINAIKNE